MALVPKSMTAQHVINAGDMSQASLTSTTVNIQDLDNIAIELIFTGTPTGTFAIQGSVDNVNFVAVTLSPAPAASGAAANILINMSQVSFPWLNIVYTKSGGTGTLDAWVSAKSI